MAQNVTETPEPYSQEEVKAAEKAEQDALSVSQNKYLTNRVVTLRAHLNRLEIENQELLLELHALRTSGVLREEPTPEE